MRMRSALAALLCLLLPWCAVGAPAARAEAGGYDLFAVNDAWLWRLTQTEAVREPLGGGEAIRFALPEGGARAASALGDELYLLTAAEAEQRVAVLDAQGAERDSYPIPAEWYAFDVAASEYGLFVLAAPDRAELTTTAFPQGASVYRWSEQAGAFERFEFPDWANEDVDAMSLSQGRFLNAAGSGALLSYDLAGGGYLMAPVNCMETYFHLQLGPIDGSGASMYVAALGDNHLWLFHGSTHELSDAGMLPEDFSGIGEGGGMLYSMDRRTGEMTSLLISAAANERYEDKLVLVNEPMQDHPRILAAIELFHQTYPDVEVTFRMENDSRVLAAGLMSGAPGFDIICTQEVDYSASSEQMFLAGGILDLSQYPDIARWLPEYLDVFGPLSSGDSLFAVPQFIQPDMWRFNDALAAQIGVERPRDGWTWDDFFAMADAVRAYNETAEEAVYLLADNLLNPSLVRQYLCAAVDFTEGTAEFGDEFAQLLDRWRSAVGDGLMLDTLNNDDIEDGVCPPNALMYRDVGSFSYQSLADPDWICPPALADDARIVAHIGSMKINANTAHEDWAVCFLSCFMNPESLRSTPVWLDGRLTKDAGWYLEEDAPMFSVTAEQDAMWEDVITRAMPEVNLGQLGGDIQWTLLPQFMSGELTAQEFAAHCQRRANIVLGE